MRNDRFAFALGERFQMEGNESSEVLYVVVDRMHTDRGNMYWLKKKDRPTRVQLFEEAFLWRRRFVDATRPRTKAGV